MLTTLEGGADERRKSNLAATGYAREPQFTWADPERYVGKISPHAYVGADPVNRTDPSGMCRADNYTMHVYDGQGRDLGPDPVYPESWSVLVGCEDFLNPGGAEGGFGGGGGGGLTRETPRPTATPKQLSGTRHRYGLRYPTLCSAPQAFERMRAPGVSAPGAPYAREGFTPRIMLPGNNPISQHVDVNSMTIINTTLPSHRYHFGTVKIQIVASGATSDISIVGTGTGSSPLQNNAIGYAFFGNAAHSVQKSCAPGYSPAMP